MKIILTEEQLKKLMESEDRPMITEIEYIDKEIIKEEKGEN